MRGVERKSDVLNLKLFYVIWRGSSDDDAESYDLPGSQMLDGHVEMNSAIRRRQDSYT